MTTQKPTSFPENGRCGSTTGTSSYLPAPPESRETSERPASPNRPLRICIASSEFLGPFRNGGIGTAYTKLGVLLSDAGNDVTFLYTNGLNSMTEPIPHWIKFYAQRGIRFVPLPESSINLSSLTTDLAISYRVFLWLREHDGFDVVHFPEYGAAGFHSGLAKHQSLALAHTTTVVGLHSSSKWARFANQQLCSSPRDLEQDFIERRAAELADVIWSPGRYMLDWAKQHGWKLEQRCHLQPYVVPPVRGQGQARLVTEVIFFGRQELRKGLLVFLDALDQLAGASRSGHFQNFQVTILGKPTTINGADSEAVIRARSPHWPFPIQILADRDHEQAIEYLKGEGRLAVIPSLVENYPNTVLECLAHEVPFFASRVGSIPEQIHPDDVERVCFEPTPRRLAERLQQALREGHAPARLSFDADQNSRSWVHWHERLLTEGREHSQPSRLAGGQARSVDPSVSVCITHYNRPHLLRQALDSIVKQDCPPLEVIVVDDGSPSASVQQALDEIIAHYDFAGRRWHLVRQENRYLGAARNRAATLAKGEYLLFMDDDNVAKSHEVGTFAAVARHTGADVLTCLMDMFQGEHAPGAHLTPSVRWLCTGANFPLSTFYNTFGDANAIIRRTAFLSVGGYTEDYGVTHEDWELFSRLLLKGYHIEVVPDALYWYRVMPGSMIAATPVKQNYLRSLRPYLEQIPEPYHQLIEMCLGRSLVDRGLLGSDGQAKYLSTAETNLPAWPLRYRIVDGLNAQLKQFTYVHKLWKKSIQGLLTLRKRISKNGLVRSQVGDAGSVFVDGPKAQQAPHFASGAARNRQRRQEEIAPNGK